MAEAEPVIRAALPDANVPTSIRSSGVPVVHGSASDLGSILDTWLAAHAEGIACVIGTHDIEDVRATSRVRSLTPELSKGLEFDLVVLIDPEAFGKGIEGTVDRYVAMTRATQQLVILTSSAGPRGPGHAGPDHTCLTSLDQIRRRSPAGAEGVEIEPEGGGGRDVHKASGVEFQFIAAVNQQVSSERYRWVQIHEPVMLDARLSVLGEFGDPVGPTSAGRDNLHRQQDSGRQQAGRISLCAGCRHDNDVRRSYGRREAVLDQHFHVR
jgi:hypothetical protein